MRNAVRPHVPAPPREPRPARALAAGRATDGGAALAVLHRAARALLDDLPDLTDHLVAVLREREPAYRAAVEGDPGHTWQEAHRALRHGIASLLDPRAAREAARRSSWRIGAARAEEGMPLDALLHAFRLGGSLVWEALVEETSRRAPDDVRLLVHVAGDVWNFVDEHCTLVADAYRQVERQLTWRRENRLRLAAGALLDGATRIADLPEAAAVLGLPERGRYAVVAVASGGHPAACAVGPAEAGATAGPRVHWHVGAEAEYGIVLVEEDDGDGRGALAALARRLGAAPGTRVGVGAVVEGLAAVGEARRLADTALRICPEDGGTVLLDDHLPAALVVSSPGLGAALVERVLGPLLRLDPADRDLLLDTLAVWLECDGSARRAGARLYCHRNTVLNRLRRCEQLTGRSLGRPADLVELALALSARRLLPHRHP
ncbi:helix-turn-helix domain-containing protein [Streptomyces sp. TRM76323]|uniref:Helix-turn-helix domain-containing protein n=1 Tax=Streptomyces tamarix TaxID=3078565 RepID=A0ABU3QMA6_9ACTN|nr:helix-turn-helix domain-containing protein [Streptomyces tamarix]MDT9683901.1 helix-turn-helix domain-containing protein [Streptomyces tamarix]